MVGGSMGLKYFVDFVFSISLLLNALLFIPQAIKIYKNKDASNLSLATFAGFNVMQFFTAYHGYLNGDYMLMAGFGLSFITCAIVTVLILIYKGK